MLILTDTIKTRLHVAMLNMTSYVLPIKYTDKSSRGDIVKSKTAIKIDIRDFLGQLSTKFLN